MVLAQVVGARVIRLYLGPGSAALTLRRGERLLDVLDDHPEHELPFSCRSATCGTCRVHVERGAEAFAPPDADERETLEAFDSLADVRLACQLVLETTSVGEVRLRPVED